MYSNWEKTWAHKRPLRQWYDNIKIIKQKLKHTHTKAFANSICDWVKFRLWSVYDNECAMRGYVIYDDGCAVRGHVICGSYNMYMMNVQ